MAKGGICIIEGCGKKVHGKGTKCSCHYEQERLAKKKAKAGTSDDDIINNLIGKPIQSPPDKPKPQVGADGKPVPVDGQKQQVAPPAVPPQMWMVIASTLNHILKTKAFEMDHETAQYLSEALTLALQENKVKASATGSFVAAIAMWVGLSLMVYLKEKAEAKPSDGAPIKGDALQGAKDWLTNLTTGRKTSMAKEAIRQQVEEAPLANYEQEPVKAETQVKPAEGPIIQRNPTLKPQEQKVRYLDLDKMSEESLKETERLKKEMEQKKLQKLGLSPGAIAP